MVVLEKHFNTDDVACNMIRGRVAYLDKVIKTLTAAKLEAQQLLDAMPVEYLVVPVAPKVKYNRFAKQPHDWSSGLSSLGSDTPW